MTAIALRHAVELLRRPGLAAVMREQPVPADVLTLIRIAAGDGAVCRQSAALTSERPERLRQAAVLYLESVLMAPDADAYRVLGVTSDASRAVLRLHLGWLMKWLHPDRTRSEWDSAFVARVLAAWEEIKTPERRARYDRERQRALGGPGVTPNATRPSVILPRHGIPWIAGRTDSKPRSWTPGRALAVALIGAAAAGIWLVPRWLP